MTDDKQRECVHEYANPRVYLSGNDGDESRGKFRDEFRTELRCLNCDYRKTTFGAHRTVEAFLDAVEAKETRDAERTAEIAQLGLPRKTIEGDVAMLWKRFLSLEGWSTAEISRLRNVNEAQEVKHDKQTTAIWDRLEALEKYQGADLSNGEGVRWALRKKLLAILSEIEFEMDRLMPDAKDVEVDCELSGVITAHTIVEKHLRTLDEE